MIVVGFLICVATGYFMQPALKRAVLRVSKCWPFTPSAAHRRPDDYLLSAEWVAKVINTDTRIVQAIRAESKAEVQRIQDEIRHKIEEQNYYLRHRY